MACGPQSLQLVSEVRVVLWKTMPLICEVCDNSGKLALAVHCTPSKCPRPCTRHLAIHYRHGSCQYLKRVEEKKVNPQLHIEEYTPLQETI